MAAVSRCEPAIYGGSVDSLLVKEYLGRRGGRSTRLKGTVQSERVSISALPFPTQHSCHEYRSERHR
jgi:hypothetical protein